MIFSEWYSAYYNAVAKILRAAVDHPLRPEELRQIVQQEAFAESLLTVEPALREERWQLLHPDGTTPLHRPPTMPLTLLQKRWLNALALDSRIGLFGEQPVVFPGVEPLFRPEDVECFDRCADGDPYEDAAYRQRFRMILEAIREKQPLSVDYTNGRGSVTHVVVRPEKLEYSEKDDKFRLIVSGSRYGNTINLGRVLRCRRWNKPYEPAKEPPACPPRTVVLELRNERNALERVLLHFAHFEKQAEKLENGCFRVRIVYDPDDEAELVIRLLSFGPMLRVTEPPELVEQIKTRLRQQKSCGR